MRQLIYIPMSHEQGDSALGLGSTVGVMDDAESQKFISLQEKLWQEIGSAAETLPRNLSGTKLFVESLREDDMEHFVKNHGFLGKDKPTKTKFQSIIRDIMDRGAIPQVTEGESYTNSLAYVKKFGQIIASMGESPNDLFTEEQVKEMYNALKGLDETMPERDRDIALSINTNLNEEESGLLFMGAEHARALEQLDPDIKVDYLDESLREIVAELKSSLKLGVYGEAFRKGMIEEFSFDPEIKG